jgi:hypothetical protein
MGAIATVAVAVAVAVSANTSTTASKVADRSASARQNAPLLTLATIAIAKLSPPGAAHHHGAKPRVRRRPPSPVKHPAVAQSASAPPVSASPPSSTGTPSPAAGTPSPAAGATASAATPTYSSHPTSTTSQSTATSSSQPAGPAGPGSTVGGNCNPKCS